MFTPDDLEDLGGLLKPLQNVGLAIHKKLAKIEMHLIRIAATSPPPLPEPSAPRITEPEKILRHSIPNGHCTKEGILRLPKRVYDHLKLDEGGGVWFVENKQGMFEILNTEQMMKLLGAEEDEVDKT